MREWISMLTSRGPFVDGKLAKRWVWINGAVPGVVLAWDAWQGQLGVNDVNYAIRTTGKLSLVFLVLALAITPLRRLTGWSWLVAARRSLGLYGCFYALAHFAIFFAFDRDASVSSTVTEIALRVYLWFGFGALVLVIPLAVTSTDGMVTRLGAKRWKLLHRLAYPATIAAVVHFYLLVKADVTQPLAFAIVTGGLLGYRGVAHYVDLRRALRAARTRAPAKRKFWSGELVVARIFQETPDVKTFRLTLQGGGPLPFEHVAGQYLNVELVIDGKRVRRSYTIASAPTRTAAVEISVKRVADGYASHFLHDRVREGDRLRVSAPAGKFVFAGHESECVVLVAGGIGITPMMAVLRSLTDRCWRGDIYLLFSVKRRADIVFRDELAHLQQRFPNLHVRITLTADGDESWTGARGQITPQLVRDFVPAITGPVLVCGPDAMMTAMRALFAELGVADAQILQEAFVSPTSTDEAVAPDAPVDDATPGTVQFQRTGTSVDAPRSLTILECAEEASVQIPFECRSGVCGQCKTKLVSGRVTMDAQDALTASDRAKGLVLACQARAVRDVVVDA